SGKKQAEPGNAPALPSGMVVANKGLDHAGWPVPTGAVRSIPGLTSAAGAEGFGNALRDSDGVVRRVPLLMRYKDMYYPSLGLAAVLLRSGDRSLRLAGGAADTTLTWGNRRIPLDRSGNLLLDFRLGKAPFPYLSAGDVLDGPAGEGTLRGKIVVVGLNARGLGDLHLVPYDGMLSGLQIHATAIDDLLAGTFISRPDWARGAELFALLLSGILTSWLLSRPGFVPALVAVAAGVGGSYWAARGLLVSQGLFVSPLLPMATPVVIMTVLGLLKHGIEARETRKHNRELIAAREALRASEERFRGALEFLPVPIGISDRAGNVVYYNTEFTRRYGYRLEDTPTLDRLVRVAFPDAAYRERSAALWKEDIDKAVRENAATPARERRIACKDGGWRDIEFITRPVGTLLVTSFNDVTAQKRAMEDLREGRERIRLVLDSTADGIFGVDREGRFTFCNAAALRMLGYENEEELLGGNVHDLVHHTKAQGTPCPREECAAQSALLSGSPFHSKEDLLWRKDGKSFLAELWTHPLRKEGEVAGAVVSFNDITERVSLEHQLNHARKMEALGTLAGGVAHDFNNKLTVILGYAEMLEILKPQGAELEQAVDMIRKAALHSRDITRKLLSFSRKEVISPRRVDLNELVEETGKGLGRLIGEDIRLDIRLSPDPWPVMLDVTQADQIIMNLAVNARDAMPDGGVLEISTRNVHVDEIYGTAQPEASAGDFVQLTVSDTGCGMEREIQEHVFEPFYTTKETGKGTGLGLATVYGIVKQNRGFITLHSEKGAGTTFNICFPRAGEGSPAPEKQTFPAARGTGTVLLVEDEEAIRQITTTMLEMLGYTVVVAREPHEAIAICASPENHLDLVLTDVVMPEMSGKMMADRISEIRPGIPVLFMSGYTADIIAAKGILEKGIHFLQKPFNMSSLGSKIESLLRQ
ncbi:MAG: sensor hybrid histidine kinase, partial [Deltaproteobacteria bacterium]|nr:sensor hybrid histidine kinase [Deltaproteobacteria bacterium]